MRSPFTKAGAGGSVRRSWVISYAAVFVLPLLVSAIGAFATQEVLRAQIRDSSGLVVELLAKELEGRLAYVVRLANDITSLPLAKLVLEEDPGRGEGEFRSNLASLADAMAAQGSYDRYDDFSFLYLSGPAGVLLPRAYYPFDDFHRFYFEGAGVSREALAGLLEGRRDNASVPLDFVDASGRRRSVVAFMRSLPPMSERPRGVFAVLIDSGNLIDSLHSAVRATGWELRILDRDRDLLVTSLVTDAVGGTVELGAQGATLRVGKREFVSTTKTLPGLGWTVQLLVPRFQVWQRLWLVQAGTLAALVLSLGVGIGLTAYALRRNYRPVRRILNELASRAEVALPASGNEFADIEAGLVRAFEQRYQAMERFDRHKGTLQEGLVSRMLQGIPELGGDWGPSLAALDMDWKGEEYFVVLAEAAEDSGEAPGLLRRRWREALEGAIGDKGRVWPSAALEEPAFVIEAAPGPGAAEAVAEALRGAALPFVASLSAAARGRDALPAALAQARAVRDHRYSRAGAGFLSFDEVPSDQVGTPYPLTAALEERFVNALRSGDEAAALEALDAIAGPGSRALEPREARCLVWDLGACLLKALPAGVLEGEPDQALLGSIEAIAGRKTVEDSIEGLAALVRDRCARIRSYNESRRDRLRELSSRKSAEKVVEYLRSRFRDPMLTLTGIAADMGYSADHLSRTFKESRGEGLMEALARIRLEEAKASLGAPGSPNLSSIARDCGFLDVNTFIRCFKKLYGITPGKYRDSLP